MIANRHISDYRVRKVISLLEDRPNYRVKELADLVNLSASRLEHIFKQETGQRLSRFIQEQKLHRASELLRSTNKQITEISYTVGYEHATSFVRAFKEQFQQTPQHYRGMVTNQRERQLVMNI
ncbi:MAG: helix-turn-helix domain-containing protein [Verrucomicrobiota bacterium]